MLLVICPGNFLFFFFFFFFPFTLILPYSPNPGTHVLKLIDFSEYDTKYYAIDLVSRFVGLNVSIFSSTLETC